MTDSSTTDDSDEELSKHEQIDAHRRQKEQRRKRHGFDPGDPEDTPRSSTRCQIQAVYDALVEAGEDEAASELREARGTKQKERARDLALDLLDERASSL